MMVVDDEAATRELVARGVGPDGEPFRGERLRYRRVFELIDRRV